MTKVCDPKNANLVPPEERISTFYDDGSLWCEQPTIQGGFMMQRLIAMAEKDAPLRQTQPWKMAYENDTSWINGAVDKHYNGDDSEVKMLLGGLGKASADMTVDAFSDMADEYFKRAKHLTYGCSYFDVAYQPMLKLLDYLKANDFTIFIVSGGGRDFMRPITPQVYGIQPERLISLSRPLSASGAKSMITLVHVMQRRNARWGLQTMCIGYGMATATVQERV